MEKVKIYHTSGGVVGDPGKTELDPPVELFDKEKILSKIQKHSMPTGSLVDFELEALNVAIYKAMKRAMRFRKRMICRKNRQ